MERIPAPEPGIYEGVPFETYLAWDAVSQSQLKQLTRSPAHLQAYLADPPQDTDALRIGRALHGAVLESDTWEEHFGVLPHGTDLRTKAGRELRDTILSHGATVLKQEEYDKLLAMRDSIYAHPAARHLLDAEGPCEVSLVWTDEETGLVCKARQDKHALVAAGVVVDLKSTTDAGVREFERSVYNFGYHRQGAFYLRAARALSVPAEHFSVIAAEKTAPYAVAVYRLDDGALDAGDGEVSALMALYARCHRRGVWPAYAQTVQDIAIPAWAWEASDRLTQEIAAEAKR